MSQPRPSHTLIIESMARAEIAASCFRLNACVGTCVCVGCSVGLSRSALCMHGQTTYYSPRHVITEKTRHE